MKALCISIISLAILVAIWGIFHQYSNDTLSTLVFHCEETIMPALENEEWDTAYPLFVNQYMQWQDYKNYALYLLDTETINKADEAFAKTMMYIKAEDASNSSGELLALQQTLKFIKQSQSISWQNIF